jgi:hypothetical protein
MIRSHGYAPGACPKLVSIFLCVEPAMTGLPLCSEIDQQKLTDLLDVGRTGICTLNGLRLVALVLIHSQCEARAVGAVSQSSTAAELDTVKVFERP